MIHVCFCFNDKTGRFSKFAGTAMLSVLENVNTPTITVDYRSYPARQHLDDR